MRTWFAVSVASAAVLVSASLAFAGENDTSPLRRADGAAPRTLVFGDGAARFDVERDAQQGRMTFRLSGTPVAVSCPPTIVVTTNGTEREVALTPVEGHPGVWSWSDDAVRSERFDGKMRIVIDGKVYSSPLATVWTRGEATQQPTAWRPRFGGRVLALPACGAGVEVVSDPRTGTLTVYSFEDVVVVDAPVITFTHAKNPTTVKLTRVEGRDGVWHTRHEYFTTSPSSSAAATIRLRVNGKACEAPLVYGFNRGGRMVSVTGGPSFEVVRDAEAGHYTFYAVDETIDGKAYTVERPTVVMNGRTYDLTRVEGEPRAWRLVGLDAAGSDARDAQLNFTLFGKTLSTRLGLSGLGVDVK